MAHVMTKSNGETVLRDEWHAIDVLNDRDWMTEENAIDVLEHIARNHDCEVGINWEVIDLWCDELYPEPEETL